LDLIFRREHVSRLIGRRDGASEIEIPILTIIERTGFVVDLVKTRVVFAVIGLSLNERRAARSLLDRVRQFVREKMFTVGSAGRILARVKENVAADGKSPRPQPAVQVSRARTGVDP